MAFRNIHDKIDNNSRVPGVWVACTGRDAVVDVLVAVGVPGEPHEAPEELNLDPDGPASVNITKSQYEHEFWERIHSFLVKSLAENGFYTGCCDSRSPRAMNSLAALVG